jgi:hypothetical protein
MFKKMVAVLALTAAFAQSASAYDLSNKFGLGISEMVSTQLQMLTLVTAFMDVTTSMNLSI